MRNVSLVLAAAAASLAAGPAWSQAAVTRNATVQPGKPARLAVVTALKRDCSVGELGSLRVVTPPKNGSLVVRSDKLKTPASFRCPNVETPVQALFYQPKANFSGTDEVAYETRTAEGQTQSFTVRINVSAKPDGKSRDILDL